MKITLDRESKKPVYNQIFEQIKQQILMGALAPGFRLPPERKLAESLGVNRSTVLGAYRELKMEGLIGSRVGQGTVVLSYPHEEHAAEEVREPAWNQVFSQYSNGFDSLIVKDLLTLANRKDIISFATGIASPESGPMEELAGIEAELVKEKDFKAMMHSPAEGFTSLREGIRGVMQNRGVYCQTDEVMVLTGSQQGIDLAARVFLDPGDMVVIEEPSFFPAIQAFKATGARLVGIPTDDGGMQVDLLEQLLQRYRPKLIYTMPTFQNPTGTCMTMERRRRLLELAYKYGVLILEDDAYGDLHYDGPVLPSLKSMDREGYVIYLSTFSKLVYPGLRLGWMAAHRKVVRRFSAAKQVMDLHSSSLSQWMIERFILSGGFDRHIPKVCREYREKRDIMWEALTRYAPRGLTWNRPVGGYYIWCRLPENISSQKLIPKAAEHRVAFVPGLPFFISEQGEEYIRLNFTFAAREEIVTGIKALCTAMKELTGKETDMEEEPEMDLNPVF